MVPLRCRARCDAEHAVGLRLLAFYVLDRAIARLLHNIHGSGGCDSRNSPGIPSGLRHVQARALSKKIPLNIAVTDGIAPASPQHKYTHATSYSILVHRCYLLT